MLVRLLNGRRGHECSELKVTVVPQVIDSEANLGCNKESPNLFNVLGVGRIVLVGVLPNKIGPVGLATIKAGAAHALYQDVLCTIHAVKDRLDLMRRAKSRRR